MPAWLRRLVPFRRYAVEVGDGLRAHVMEAGPEDGLPVVMVHGNPTWGFLYRKVVARLHGSGLRIVLPDLVGLGFSDKPRDPAIHTLENHIGWMRRTLDAAGIGDRCVMVVQDWGGAVGVGALAAHEAAAAGPGREVGLVVLNTVLSPPKKGFKATAFHRFARAPVVSGVAFRLLGFPQAALHRAQGDRGSIRGETAAAYKYPLRRLRENAAPLALARMVPDTFEHSSIAPLERVRAWVDAFEGPAAIVWGDRDPVLGRVRSFIEKLFPQARTTRTDAGHFLQEEVPDEIAAAVREVAGKMASGAPARS